MNPSKLLKLSSILAGLQYAAHAVMFLSAKPAHGHRETLVLEVMKNQRFDFGGFSRSYWDFYFGYGLLAILWGVVEIALLWQLSVLAAKDASRLSPIVALLLLANIAHGVLAALFFFPAPVVGDAVVAASLAWALLALRAKTASAPTRSTGSAP
jgi:hypothetical protein